MPNSRATEHEHEQLRQPAAGQPSGAEASGEQALDSVERALRMTPEDQGLRAVLAQMETILHRHGATRVGAAGERFDPAVHEAVDVRTGDGLPDWTILEVARSGFALGDRVLRPAQVIVSRQPQAGG